MKQFSISVVIAQVAVVAFACVSPLAAQLIPDRVYYGVDRVIPMTVMAPSDGADDLVVRLLTPASATVATASVAEGGVDLSALFPTLWTDKVNEIRYAQLYAGDEPVGPGVVLQPMTSPDTAAILDPRNLQPAADPRAGRVTFDSDRQRILHDAGVAASPERPVTYSGVRAWVDRHVILSTSAGEIEIAVRPDAAPNTSWNFVMLAEGGLYTGIEIHRIIASLPSTGEPFVIQAGDPTGTGAGGPGFFIDLEKSDLPHDYGVVSMARSGNPNSNGSQFFICLSRPGTEFLDGNYTSFAEVVRGVDAITAISSAETGAGDRPLAPPVIESARTVPAPPRGTGPARVTRPDTGGTR